MRKQRLPFFLSLCNQYYEFFGCEKNKKKNENENDTKDREEQKWRNLRIM